jgi:hypothetical protein
MSKNPVNPVNPVKKSSCLHELHGKINFSVYLLQNHAIISLLDVLEQTGVEKGKNGGRAGP